MMYSQQYLNRRRAWVAYWIYSAALENIVTSVGNRHGSGPATQVKEFLLKPYLDNVQSLWLWSTNRFSSVLHEVTYRTENDPLREPDEPAVTDEIVNSCWSRMRSGDSTILARIRNGLASWNQISQLERQEPIPPTTYSVYHNQILRGCVSIASCMGVCPVESPVEWGAQAPHRLDLGSTTRRAVLTLTHLLGRPLDRELTDSFVRVALESLVQFINLIDYQIRIEDFNTPDTFVNSDYRDAISAIWSSLDMQTTLASSCGFVTQLNETVRQLQANLGRTVRMPDPTVTKNRCYLPERTLLGADLGSANGQTQSYIRRLGMLARLARELLWVCETEDGTSDCHNGTRLRSDTHHVIANLESVIEESIDGNTSLLNLDGSARVRDDYRSLDFEYGTVRVVDDTRPRDIKARNLLIQVSAYLTTVRTNALHGGISAFAPVPVDIRQIIVPALELGSILRSEDEQEDRTFIQSYARMLYGLYLEGDYQVSEVFQLANLIQEGLVPPPPPVPPSPIRLEDPTDRPEPAISGDGIQSAARLYEWLVGKHHLAVRTPRDVWAVVMSTPHAADAARAVGYGRFVCATHHHIHCEVCRCPVCGAPGGCNCQGRRVRRYSEGPPVIAARRDARRVGVELEVETSSIEALQTLLAEYPYCHSDSTLTEYGAEVKIIGYSDRLHTLGRLVTRIFRSKEIQTKPNCGFHVHVERRPFDSMNDIHARWLAIEPEVFDLFPSRARNEFCKSLRISDIADHHSVLSMSRHGTWEFRVHPGTVSWVVAACWADWCVGFVEGRKADLGAAYWDARKATRALLNTLNPPQTPPPPPPVQIPTERNGEDFDPVQHLVPLVSRTNTENERWMARHRVQPIFGTYTTTNSPAWTVWTDTRANNGSGNISVTHEDRLGHVDETIGEEPAPVPAVEALPIVEFPPAEDMNQFINRTLRPAARPRIRSNAETGRARPPRLADRPQDMETRGKIEKSTHPWAWRLAVHQVNQRVQQKQVIKAIQDGVFREFEDEKRVLEAKDKVLAMHAEAQQVLRQ